MPRFSILPFRRKSFSRGRSGKYGNVDEDGDIHPLVWQPSGDFLGTSQNKANGNGNYHGRSRSLSADSFRRKSHSYLHDPVGFGTCRPCSCQCTTSNSGYTGALDKSDNRPSMLVWKGRKPRNGNARDYDDNSTDDSSLSNYRYDRRSPCDDIAVHVGDAVLNLVDGMAACLSIFHEDCGDRTTGRSRRKRGKKSARKVTKESFAPRKVTAEELRDDPRAWKEFSCRQMSCFGRDRNSPQTVATVESSESLDREDDEELGEFVNSRAKSTAVMNTESKVPHPMEEFADFTAAPMQVDEELVRQDPMKITLDQNFIKTPRDAKKPKQMKNTSSVRAPPREEEKPKAMTITSSRTLDPKEQENPNSMNITSSLRTIPTEPEKPNPNEIISSSMSADSSEMVESKLCSNCGTTPNDSVKLKLCSRCQSVYYCGPACQAKHWYEGHLHNCKAIRA